jgi:hypothetical protein
MWWLDFGCHFDGQIFLKIIYLCFEIKIWSLQDYILKSLSFLLSLNLSFKEGEYIYIYIKNYGVQLLGLLLFYRIL